MNVEMWKPLEGYTVRYEVSNLGRVRSVRRMAHDPEAGTGDVWGMLPAKVLPVLIGSDGFHVVGLVKNGQRVSRSVAHLVATMFIREPMVGEQLYHIDGCFADNSAYNLEWATVAPQRPRKKLVGQGRRKPVVLIPVTGVGLWFPSVTSVVFSGFCMRSVHKCLAGSLRTYHGHTWRYA